MKVFISYNSEDRTRFVDDFVEKLENKNIEVWYDKERLKYGENLAKIIHEMLKCDYFICIYSKNSINSNWVKEECDAALVAKIKGKIKMIMINLLEDEISIPPEFEHIRIWDIENINNYNSEFNEISGEILGLSNRKIKGNYPKYIGFSPIINYEIIDSIIIKKIGDLMSSEDSVLISFDYLMKLIDDEDISERDVDESIRILESDGIIKFNNVITGIHPENIKLTSKGIVLYAENYCVNYSNILQDISSIILNKEAQIDENHFKNIEVPEIIKRSIIDYFSMLGYIKLNRFLDGSFLIQNITGVGKRKLKSLLN